MFENATWKKSTSHQETSSSQTTEADSRASPSILGEVDGQLLDGVDNSQAELSMLDLERGPSEDTIPHNRDGNEDKKEVYDGVELGEKDTARSARISNLVTWNDENDCTNPKNWSFKRKWAATIIGVISL